MDYLALRLRERRRTVLVRRVVVKRQQAAGDSGSSEQSPETPVARRVVPSMPLAVLEAAAWRACPKFDRGCRFERCARAKREDRDASAKVRLVAWPDGLIWAKVRLLYVKKNFLHQILGIQLNTRAYT
jgi:hypothetical protein